MTRQWRKPLPLLDIICNEIFSKLMINAQNSPQKYTNLCFKIFQSSKLGRLEVVLGKAGRKESVMGGLRQTGADNVTPVN